MDISEKGMRRNMRRTKRQVFKREWINEVLDKADVLSLGLCTSSGLPYVLPIRFGRDGNLLYIHCSLRGLKAEIIKDNPIAAFSAWIDVERHPRPNTIMDKWKQSYKSVCGWGRIIPVVDNEDKLHAVNIIKTHYKESLENYSIEPTILEKVLGIYAIHMDHVTGRVKGYENPDNPGMIV